MLVFTGEERREEVRGVCTDAAEAAVTSHVTHIRHAAHAGIQVIRSAVLFILVNPLGIVSVVLL